MKSFSKSPVVSPPKPQRQLQAEIMWGGRDGWNSYFPKDMDEICGRAYSPHPQPSEDFGRAVKAASERVLVIDEYFLLPNGRNPRPEERITTILGWLSPDLGASDIRILTKKHDEITEDLLQRFKKREEEINTRRPRCPKQCSIQLSTRLTEKFEHIHDRFAIIDDELWHFGATVGGFHSKVNAASRGWSAEDSGAIEFFELAWAKCKER